MLFGRRVFDGTGRKLRLSFGVHSDLGHLLNLFPAGSVVDDPELTTGLRRRAHVSLAFPPR